jgi:DNA-binding NarL/FixJ family response regulator
MVMRVLIVDPDKVLLGLYRRVLTHHVSVVACVSTAEQARARLATDPFDVVISAYTLPDGTGAELVDEVRRAMPMTQPLIVCQDVADRRADLAQQGVPFIPKPVNLADLVQFVRDAQRARGTRAVRRCVGRWQAAYGLTDAEADVLQRSAFGVRRAYLADARGVSENTIKSLIARLLAKSGDSSLDIAVMRLLREALAV